MTRTAAAAVPTPPRRRGRPPTLEALMSACEGTEARWGLRQNDAAFALAFWAMLDCGFECVSGGDALPKDWKHETRQVYEARFFLPPYAERPVRLVALPSGDVLCINVLAAGVSPKNVSLRSLAVRYVPGTDLPQGTDFHLTLKDGIIWPIRCSILTEEGVTNGSLCGVSDEIKLKIVGHLGVKDVLTLSETCHGLNRICNDQSVWKALFHEEFDLCKCSDGKEDCEEGVDWKEKFKEAHARRKAGSHVRSSSSLAEPVGPFGSQIDLDVD